MEKRSNIKVKVRAIFVLKISFNLTSSFLKKKDEERYDSESDDHPLSRLLSG